MGAVTWVLLVAETPEHDSTQNPGQPSSTMKGYRVEAQDGETVSDVLNRVLSDGSLGPFGLGTNFYGFDLDAAVRLTLASSLVEPPEGGGHS
jgi:hypothetical protein